jgi:hypothetical protein
LETTTPIATRNEARDLVNADLREEQVVVARRPGAYPQ